MKHLILLTTLNVGGILFLASPIMSAASFSATCNGVTSTTLSPINIGGCSTPDFALVAQAGAELGAPEPMPIFVDTTFSMGGTGSDAGQVTFSGTAEVTVNLLSPGTAGANWSGSAGWFVPCIYSYGATSDASGAFGATSVVGNPSTQAYGTCASGAASIPFTFGTAVSVPFSFFANNPGVIPMGSPSYQTGVSLMGFNVYDSAGDQIGAPYLTTFPCNTPGCPGIDVGVEVDGLSTPSNAPEPSTLVLLVAGAGVLALSRRRHRG